MHLFHWIFLCASFAPPRLCGKRYLNLVNFPDSCTVSGGGRLHHLDQPAAEGELGAFEHRARNDRQGRSAQGRWQRSLHYG